MRARGAARPRVSSETLNKTSIDEFKVHGQAFPLKFVRMPTICSAVLRAHTMHNCYARAAQTPALIRASKGEVLVAGIPWMRSGESFVGEHQHMLDELGATPDRVFAKIPHEGK